MYQKKRRVITLSLEGVLAFSYFILPAYSFGEREYLLIVLIMPYLLLAVMHLSQQSVGTLMGTSAGILAAIGFAQKPYFLLMWLGVEIYLIVKTKSLKTLWRPEGLSCVIIYILYGLTVFIITPEYITKILPHIVSTYYLINKSAYYTLILHPTTFFTVLLMILTLLLRKNSAKPFMLDILLIALSGALFIYLAQQTLWSYHMLPVYMLGSLLLTVLIVECLMQRNLAQIQTINQYFYNFLGLAFALSLPIGLLIMVASKGIMASFFYRDLIFKQPIFNFLKTMPGATVYVFTNDQLTHYLLLDYSSVYTPSKFNSLWNITAANALSAGSVDPAMQQHAKNIADFVRQADADAIIKAKPAYILVQCFEYQVSNGAAKFWSNHFILKRTLVDNHLQFFLKSKKFADFWRYYRYVGTIGNFAVYKSPKA